MGERRRRADVGWAVGGRYRWAVASASSTGAARERLLIASDHNLTKAGNAWMSAIGVAGVRGGYGAGVSAAECSGASQARAGVGVEWEVATISLSSFFTYVRMVSCAFPLPVRDVCLVQT